MPLPPGVRELSFETPLNMINPTEPNARLVCCADNVPPNLEDLLRELGVGDNRFSGTSFGRGECDLPTFLQECRDHEAGRNIPQGKVPQSTYWLIDGSGSAVGIVRVRHHLNERLLQYGGHIGYYVSPAARGHGYGKLALRLGLEQLRGLGIDRGLLTVNPANSPSIRVVLANGGVQDGQGVDPVTGEIVNRYWIKL
jgi:predicted acetyltransferase